MKTKILIEEVGISISNDKFESFIPFSVDPVIVYVNYLRNEYISINENGEVKSNVVFDLNENEITFDYDKSFIIIKSYTVGVIGFSDVLKDINVDTSRICEDIISSYNQKELLTIVLNKLWHK